MKRLLALSVFFSAAALADSYNGTLIDEMCKDKKDVAAHPAKCAIACSKSGYGLMTAEGKFVKFDETGNEKALAALKATSKEKDLKATVQGTMDGDTLKVESISLD